MGEGRGQISVRGAKCERRSGSAAGTRKRWGGEGARVGDGARHALVRGESA